MRLWPVLLGCAMVACSSRHHSDIDGIAVFEGPVTLERGESSDVARREYSISAAGTYVAIVEEDDADVRLRVDRLREDKSTIGFINVESRQNGEGIEVAALDVGPGDVLRVSLETPREFDHPRSVRMKLLRYDESASTQPAISSRLQAFHAWTAATRFEITANEARDIGLPKLDAAIAHLQSPEGDPHLAAWARLVRSQINYGFFLGWRAALIDARHARHAFERLNEARNAARARFLEAATLIEIAVDKNARDPTAEEAGKEGVRAFRELAAEPASSARERARSINNLGYHAYGAGDLIEAQARFAQALEAYRDIGDRAGIRQVLGNLAVMSFELGNLQEAQRRYDELVPQLAEIPLPEIRAAHLTNAALIDIYVSSGHTDRAIERFLLVLQWARELQMPHHEARAFHGLGLAYRQRGDIAQAATFINEGLNVRRQATDSTGLVTSLRAAGDIARYAGDTAKALELHEEALALTDSDDFRIRILTDIALDHAAAGDTERAIERCREAITKYGSKVTEFRRSPTDMALAELLLVRKQRTQRDVNEATELASRSLERAVAYADIELEQAARKALAQARVARGELTEARREYESAMALIFRYRATTTSPEQQATALARQESTFRGYIDLMMRDVAARGAGKLLPAGAAEEDALRVLESARAINFDSVRVARVELSTQARIDKLLGQMADKRVRMAAALDRARAPGPELAILQLDIARLRAEIDRERARSPRAGTGVGWSQEISQPWPALTAGVTQLSYALGERHAYLWIRNAAGIRSTVLAHSSGIVERELGRLRELGRTLSPAEVDDAYRRISSWLVPEGAVAPESTKLEIVAEGLMASVPFAFLRSPANRAQHLSETHSIAMISSMFKTAGVGVGDGASRRALRFVALWNDQRPLREAPQGRLFPALSSPAVEASGIAAMYGQKTAAPGIKLLTGAAANSDEIKTLWLQGADVFHFATHGLADLRQPLASLLMLPASDGAGNPTYLTAGQVQEWRGDADLVYLSACDTAVGPARFADGMPGLQRAFLRAGARGVIATLWPIEDVYASQFATDFYRRYTSGIPAAQALSENQRTWARPVPGMSAREQAHRRMTAWAHVYYMQ